MDKKAEILSFIPTQGMLPLYFNKDQDTSLGILKALYSAGIRTVEYTNRGEAALINFAAMRKLCDAEMKDMYLGIGTVKTAETAQQFIDAGADYIISPGLIPEVAEISDRNDKLWVPGAMTPSEIIAAENLGAKFVKLFPGNILGTAFVSAIKELFPKLMFMPTGGVDTTQANLEGWFKSGVVAVGMGSKLITKELMESKDFDKITEDTKAVSAIIKGIKNKP